MHGLACTAAAAPRPPARQLCALAPASSRARSSSRPRIALFFPGSSRPSAGDSPKGAGGAKRSPAPNFPGNGRRVRLQSTLTKPNIFLEALPSDEADEVLVKCQIPPVSPFTRIILCEDGVEIKSQKQKGAIFLYKFSYKISRASTRQLSCMYQNKDKNNQVNNSFPSDARNLSVSGASNNAGSLGFEISLALGFGIATASTFICAALFYVLEKRGIIKWRATRYPERENQTQGQPVGSFNDESERNPLHVYTDISISPVSGIYCQAEAPKGILHPAYSHVSFKKRQEAHPALGRFCEEEV